MPKRLFQPADDCPYRLLVGVGGIGTGAFFELEGGHCLGRNESRPGRLLDVRDYCKLHIICHYAAVLLGADPSGDPFRVLPIGKVGRDGQGQHLIQEMSEAGMDTRFVEALSDRPTLYSVCFQYPDGSGGNITASNAAASALTPGHVDEVAPLLAETAGRFIAVAAPEVPLDARGRLLELATRHGGFRAAAFTSAEMPEARESSMFSQIDLMSMNEDEASALTHVAFDPHDPRGLLDAVSASLRECNPEMKIIVSAGEKGAYGYANGTWDRSPAIPVPVASTAGAGDALLAGVLVGRVAGLPLICQGSQRQCISQRPLQSGLDLAVLLASGTCTSRHTIHPKVDADMLFALADEHGLRVSQGITQRTVS